MTTSRPRPSRWSASKSAFCWSPARLHPKSNFFTMRLMRDQHIESAIWIQHADPGYKQGGDRPIIRLPSDADELGRYDALLLIDPDMRALGCTVVGADHQLRGERRRWTHFRARRALLAAVLRGR